VIVAAIALATMIAHDRIYEPDAKMIGFPSTESVHKMWNPNRHSGVASGKLTLRRVATATRNQENNELQQVAGIYPRWHKTC
jgi:hypothetical protein